MTLTTILEAITSTGDSFLGGSGRFVALIGALILVGIVFSLLPRLLRLFRK